MVAPPNIELAGVEVAHEARPGSAVVHGVDWAIRPGERWAVCGGPTSGKTSVLCTAAGLDAPVGGSFRTFGRDYWRVGEAERLALSRRIGFVFDGGGRLFAHMSILENVALPLAYHHGYERAEARERALELLARLGVEDWADAAPARLTTALQRRVALARTLTEPVEALFLDAPLDGLSPGDAGWWLQILRDLSEGAGAGARLVSVVVSGYDPGPWLGWASRFGALDDQAFRVLDESEVGASPLLGQGP